MLSTHRSKRWPTKVRLVEDGPWPCALSTSAKREHCVVSSGSPPSSQNESSCQRDEILGTLSKLPSSERQRWLQWEAACGLEFQACCDVALTEFFLNIKSPARTSKPLSSAAPSESSRQNGVRPFSNSAESQSRVKTTPSHAVDCYGKRDSKLVYA